MCIKNIDISFVVRTIYYRRMFSLTLFFAFLSSLIFSMMSDFDFMGRLGSSYLYLVEIIFNYASFFQIMYVVYA